MALWAAIIVSREITISALREWMAAIGQSAHVRVALIGKIKTIVQMVALIRSEEHTSELQSLMRISYAVFCLKKKKNNTHFYKNDRQIQLTEFYHTHAAKIKTLEVH